MRRIPQQLLNGMKCSLRVLETPLIFYLRAMAACATTSQRDRILTLVMVKGPPAITKSFELKRSPPLLKRTPELVLPLIYKSACICYLNHLSFSHFPSATCRARTLQRDWCLGHASVDQLASPLKRDIESPISFAFKARLELLVVAATLDKIGARPCR